MKNEEFTEQLAAALKEQLEARGFHDVKTEFHDIEKANGGYEAITVRLGDNPIGVNVNASQLFDAYENGADFDGVLDQAVLSTMSGLNNVQTIDVAKLQNYDQMKDTLAIEAISSERNASLLNKVPHENMEDIALVYRFVMETSDQGRSSVLITNDMIQQMGVTPEQLKADALENAPIVRPAVIQGMNEVMMELMGPDAFELMGMPQFPEESVYVASVPDKVEGAGVIAYQDFMDQAAEKIGGDFFILPSSIHEILLVPDDGLKTANELRQMVQEINASEVLPADKLTDNVYHYDSQDHIFELAEKFEIRQSEKEMEAGERAEEGKSVLKDLQSKKQEIGAKPPAKNVAEKTANVRDEAAR